MKTNKFAIGSYSSVGLERLLDRQEVLGSNPSTNTIIFSIHSNRLKTDESLQTKFFEICISSTIQIY